MTDIRVFKIIVARLVDDAVNKYKYNRMIVMTVRLFLKGCQYYLLLLDKRHERFRRGNERVGETCVASHDCGTSANNFLTEDLLLVTKSEIYHVGFFKTLSFPGNMHLPHEMCSCTLSLSLSLLELGDKQLTGKLGTIWSSRTVMTGLDFAASYNTVGSL